MVNARGVGRVGRAGKREVPFEEVAVIERGGGVVWGGVAREFARFLENALGRWIDRHCEEF